MQIDGLVGGYIRGATGSVRPPCGSQYPGKAGTAHDTRYRPTHAVVFSFLFVLGTNGRMQPEVMAPKNRPVHVADSSMDPKLIRYGVALIRNVKKSV